MKKIGLLFSLLSFLSFINVDAEVRDNYIPNLKISINDVETTKLSDNNYSTYENINKDSVIKITSDSNMIGLYIIYSFKSEEGLIYYDNQTQIIGQNDFLHEFVEIDETSSISITYHENVIIKEVFGFDLTIPAWVQKWQTPCEDADFMLFTTHSDDEHIFFAGLIPTMINSNKKVQVIYGARHEKNAIRLDELLNGLWVAGVKNYPIIGIIPDKYSLSLENAINKLAESNITVDDLIKFKVDMIRRFKPEVIATHDENGEYGHGQHRLVTYTLKEALKYVNEKSYESEYAPFNPYKVYIHLYKENPITMNYDIPLEKYNSQTAYRVSMNALSEHNSQMKSKWRKWRDFKSATEVTEYSPLHYGLYYSLVGYENKDNDMFYNVPLKIEKEELIEKDESEVMIDNYISQDKSKIADLDVLIILTACILFIGFIIILSLLRK